MAGAGPIGIRLTAFASGLYQPDTFIRVRRLPLKIVVTGALCLIVIWVTLRTIRNRNNELILSREPLLTPFALFCLIFALFGMLVIGSMIPFVGAIVRYRSIYLPFLLAPALYSLRTLSVIQSLKRWLTNKLHFLI